MPATDGLKEKLSAIVGEGRVSDDAAALSSYQSAGLADGGDPLLVVRPAETGQVRDLVKLANEGGLNLVVSSSGPPRFRGDTVPHGEAVIVDMSGMDRVLRVDRRNKVGLIEPGVTFAQLKEEARKAGLRPLMPLLPRATKSVIASGLEREPILIPRYHWDMTDPLLCTELVFGTGDLFRTGSSAGPGSLKEQWDKGLAQKNPMGPAQTDFLRIVQGSQGTMAAVTWATVKLELEPALHRLHFVPTDKLERLVDFSYRALRPKLAEEFFILNAFTLATMIAEDPAEIKELAARQAPYTLVYGVSGFEYLPEQRVAFQENDLGDIAQAAGLRSTREVPGSTWRRMDEIISNPSPEPYYKTRAKGAFCEILFLATLDRAASLVQVAWEAAARHGYPAEELGLYIQPIQHGRTCHMEFNIYFDPDDPAEASRARELHQDASRALDEAGAFFSRPYGVWSEMAYASCPDTVVALKKVKEMLDPAGVLNRGKLCFNGNFGPGLSGPASTAGRPRKPKKEVG
jgi:FAD/FMN-containing dehydrogenase